MTFIFSISMQAIFLWPASPHTHITSGKHTSAICLHKWPQIVYGQRRWPHLPKYLKLYVHSVNYAAKLFVPDVPFPALSSTLIRRRFQVKPATLLIPVDSFLVLLVAELYDTQYQSSFLSLIMWGVAFTACVVFLFFCRGFCAVPLLCATGFGV